MKVLFLDIDGVLNSHRTAYAFGGFPHELTGYHRERFDEVAIRLIRGIVKTAGAKVVLSSSWRITHDFADVGRALELPIIDATPRLASNRGAEIAAWLAKHPDVEQYAIVDDDSDMLDGQLSRFVRTSYEDGFRWEHADQLASLLGINIYDVNRPSAATDERSAAPTPLTGARKPNDLPPPPLWKECAMPDTTIFKALGYMSEKQALAEGFSHHGKYFGIPLWIGDPDGEMLVATKWAPMEHLMTAFHFIEGFMRSLLFPNDPPTFQFLVGAAIRRGGDHG